MMTSLIDKLVIPDDPDREIALKKALIYLSNRTINETDFVLYTGEIIILPFFIIATQSIFSDELKKNIYKYIKRPV